MQTVDIMLDDLTEEKQKEILKAANLKNAAEGNYDTFPLTVLEFEEVKT